MPLTAHVIVCLLMDKLSSSLLKSLFTDKKTKISSDALVLSDYLITLYAEETLLRSISTAKRSKKEEVSIGEIEVNLVQLFLDFSA